jgi:hypothetical protein
MKFEINTVYFSPSPHINRYNLPIYTIQLHYYLTLLYQIVKEEEKNMALAQSKLVDLMFEK